MFEDCAIVRFYYYVGGDCKLMRVKYTCDENGEVTLGDVNEVRVTYEDVIVAEPNHELEETTGVTQTDLSTEPTSDETFDEVSNVVEDNSSETSPTEITEEETFVEDEKVEDEENTKCEEDKDPEEDPSSEPEEDKDPKEEDEEDPKEDEDQFVDAACNGGAADTGAAQVVNAEVTPEIEKVSVEDETTKETNSGSTSFTQSERAELEALKREKKIALVSSYKDDLSEEDIEDFMSKIDSFDIKDLEIELLKAYKSKSTQKKPMRAFAFAHPNNAKNENSLDALVKKYKRK